jgi:nucleotide-binding universal stress UspA family protein
VAIPRAVVVPVDGSNFAEHAIPYGLAVARRTGAPLHLALVHVPGDLATPGYPLAEAVAARVAQDRDREANYLQELMERLAPSGVELRPALLRGAVADALSGYAEEHEVDLVIMTTHGRGGLQRAWLGSTTDGMIRRCCAPLLLIRPCDETREILPSSDRAFTRVLVALDGSETAERALADAVELPLTDDASLVLAHVMAPAVAAASPYLPQTIQLSEEEMAHREESLGAYLKSVAAVTELGDRAVETRVVVDYDVAPAVIALAEEVDADLIALGTHGRTGLRRMVLGSVADKVIRGTRRAVLVHRGRGGASWRRPRQEVDRSRPVQETPLST